MEWSVGWPVSMNSITHWMITLSLYILRKKCIFSHTLQLYSHTALMRCESSLIGEVRIAQELVCEAS